MVARIVLRLLKKTKIPQHRATTSLLLWFGKRTEAQSFCHELAFQGHRPIQGADTNIAQPLQ